jgi:benzoate membrane transport protein
MSATAETRQHGSWITLTAAAVAAVVVGFVSTILVVMKGAEAVGASLAQQSSVAASLCYGMAITTLYLCWRHRMPLITAWSTPGSAVLAGSAAAVHGITYADATGAFMLAGALMVVTALFAPLARAIEKMPASIAAAMLAGVLFKFILAVPGAAVTAPMLVLPLIVVYFGLKLMGSMYAVPAVVVLAIGIAVASGQLASEVPMEITPLIFTWPTWNWQAAVSIAVPLYLVTMASQNLPGFAVQRANGYQPPVASCLATTGIGSALCAPFGTHAINMAAITASLAAAPDAHHDPAQRWKTAIPYFIVYVIFGLAAATFVGTLTVLPQPIVAAIAGLALFGPTTNGIAVMMKNPKEIDAALVTFAVTASGITLMGIGAAFWGLVAGMVIFGVKTLLDRARD